VGTPIYLNTRNCNFRTSTTEGKHPEKGSDLRTPKIVVFWRFWDLFGSYRFPESVTNRSEVWKRM